MSQDFKNDLEVPPEPDSGQKLAAEPPTEADTGQPSPPIPTPQAEGEQAHWGVFKTPPRVLEAIAVNQRDAQWWANRDDLEFLRDWSLILIKALDLRVKDAVFLGVPPIKIERLPMRTLGAYHPDPDGYALVGTIVLNEERLQTLEPFMKLALLLKLLLCAWQHQRGGDGTLDRECREMMKSKGLVITEKGAITIKDGPFRRLLGSRGIEAPVATAFPRPVRKGKTTLRVWSCACQRCRVGTKEFFAVCPECGEPFRLGDHLGKRFVGVGA